MVQSIIHIALVVKDYDGAMGVQDDTAHLETHLLYGVK